MGEEKLSTLIVEPRFLVREALVCLMKTHSYRVVGAVPSALDIDEAAITNAPKLAILAPNSLASAPAEASAIKRLWPETKIMLLFEEASAADLDKMLTLQIDACMPFFVSPDAFVGVLERIEETGLRMLLMGRSLGTLASGPASGLQQPGETQLIRSDRNLRSGTATGVRQLSDREQQILKDLAKGHSNKVIARTCSLAEATVKVHLKSILRKTRLANRTQAAIWAVENGYAA